MKESILPIALSSVAHFIFGKYTCSGIIVYRGKHHLEWPVESLHKQKLLSMPILLWDCSMCQEHCAGRTQR